jgi:hypothetical protein
VRAAQLNENGTLGRKKVISMTPNVAILGASVTLITMTGAFVCSMGAVRVEVQSKSPGGEHIYVIAPAMVLPVGAMLVPKEKIREASRQLQPWLPTIRAATEELLRCPDGPLVQVDNRHEHVKIAKVNDALVIDVDDETETVHVSVPLRAAAYGCSRLADEAQAEHEATPGQPI